MSSIDITKLLSERHYSFGRTWFYKFRTLPVFARADLANTFIDSLFGKFAVQTGSWSNDINSEWISRFYIAGRMAMGSTLNVNSCIHAQSINLRLPISYLQYYAVLFAMRAAVITSPREEWKNGDLQKMTHNKALNVSCDIIRTLCGSSKADEIKDLIIQMRYNRELISYFAPTGGDGGVSIPDAGSVVEICTLLFEIAQLQSEVLEASAMKKIAPGFKFKFDMKYAEQAFSVKLGDMALVDKNDKYRLSYIARKRPIVCNVAHLISEGHSEDFFGSWCCDTDEFEAPTIFNPDNDTQIIFDIP